ncbi:hypothetical protein M9H77_08364 [Catharanthus roseus]|uniref:Uncharacterized protein n=1 Tax=Catharanthus roseus TaxID=4058 RepID=A0ACC0BXU6_CATRO|nr:hypothetical protein M9H77_08364 [Catharanthus roseus]
MPYHLAILHRPVLDGERGKGEAGLEERAVQGRGDIASKQQSSPFRTDYNNSLLYLLAMLCLSKLAKASLAALYSLRCSTELSSFSSSLKPSSSEIFSSGSWIASVTGLLQMFLRRLFSQTCTSIGL